MKIIKKIICFILFFSLSVPLLCMSVSAAESSSSELIQPSYYGIDTFAPNADGSGFKLNAEDIDSSGKPLFFEKNIIDSDVTDEEKQTIYGSKVSGKTFIRPGYALYDEGMANVYDSYVLFTRTLYSMNTQHSVVFNTTDEYYYFSFSYAFTTDDSFEGKKSGNYVYQGRISHEFVTLLSTTPFEFVSTDKGFYLDSNSTVYCTSAYFIDEFGTYNNEPYSWSYYKSDGINNHKSIYFDSNLKYIKTITDGYTNLVISNCYTNCNIDTSMFDNDDNLVKGLNKFLPEFDELIDVKLTPDFDYDMDRVYDVNTGQDDYFKFEVTNNSDTAIQFCASIVDGTFKDSYKNDGHSSSSGTFGDTTDSNTANDESTINPNSDFNGYNLIKTSHWNYITEISYYYPTYTLDNNYAIDEIIISSDFRMGNYYFVYLKPGEKFEDYIYWENINIRANHEYTFVVQAFPTTLNYATDIFYYSLSEKEIFPFITDTLNSISNSGETFIEEDLGIDIDDNSLGIDDILSLFADSKIDVSVNKAFYNYSLSLDDVRTVYCEPFSVKTIPNFTTDVAGGNSKITSGWQDTVTQADNPYYRNDNATGNIIPVTGYSEFNGNTSNGFSYDINNASADDVMGYLNYTENFFTLIGSTLQTFPNFIWGLIAFGLTAFTVIAIVKWIIT